jgi:hypothetical protein
MDMIRTATRTCCRRPAAALAGILFWCTGRAAAGQIAEQIREQFSVPQVAIKVWDVAAAMVAQVFREGVSDDAKTVCVLADRAVLRCQHRFRGRDLAGR